MRSTLVPSAAPDWPGIEMGISCFKDFRAAGIYYDFFKLSNETYGIVIGESSTKGAESFITTACFRGMVRVLYHLTKRPVELVTVLNDLLVNDKIGPIFNLNYIVLNPKENLITYVSLGYGNLWYVTKDGKSPINCSLNQIAAGIDSHAEIKEASLEWNIGDVLILNTFSSFESDGKKGWELDEEAFVSAIQDNISIHPQKQVDNILRKTRMTANDLTKGRMLTLISIKRVE